MGWIDPKRLQIQKTGDSCVLGLQYSSPVFAVVCVCAKSKSRAVLFILHKIDSVYFVPNVEKAHLPLKHLERYGIICVLINLCVRTAFK